MAAFGAQQGSHTNQTATPAREGKGHDADVEAPKGEIKTGIISEGIKGTGKGFGA